MRPVTPDQLYGDLFVDVQMSEIFTDSKTFVDMVAQSPVEEILQRYAQTKSDVDFDLRTFVDRYFKTEERPKAINTDSTVDISTHIHHLWEGLQRSDEDTLSHGSSKIPLPHPYVVPGGRFNEVYYWDSYFTMVGLVRADRVDLALGMLRNFTYLIETYGHIPNGNRTYFLSRSQPPFYSLMYPLLEDHLDVTDQQRCHMAMIKEYGFWMDGADHLTDDQTCYRRVVRTGGHLVNRYFDDSATPRQESYREDVTDAKDLEDKAAFYRHIRAACESGWDFSSRWLSDIDDITTIRTCDIVPVDLNCLLWHLEAVLARTSISNADRKLYQGLADRRSQAIEALCWRSDEGHFGDYLYTEQCSTGRETAAMVFPLFCGLASMSQARQVAAILEDRFIKAGGMMTTLAHTTQQWDAPNGWGPLQYMAVYGLDRYMLVDEAQRIATAWCHACEAKYEQDKKLIEKYNVIDPLHTAKGGEYPAQDGFGWTNAVYIDFIHYLDPE